MKSFPNYLGILVTVSLLTFSIPMSVMAQIEIKIEKKNKENIYLDILNFLVESSEGTLAIKMIDVETTQAREFTMIKNGDLDLGHAGTSQELEKNYIPIRYPLLRGLSGFRLLMTNKRYASEFNKIRSVSELGQYSGVQAIGWVDAKILNAGGLPQKEVLWENIFPMIDAGREVYLSFGVLDSYQKYDQDGLSRTDVVINEKLAIFYPFCIYFFVNKDREDIARKIEAIFQKVYKDGSFLNFFYSHPYIRESLNKARISERTVIAIPNPLLSEQSQSLPAYLFHEGMHPSVNLQ